MFRSGYRRAMPATAAALVLLTSYGASHRLNAQPRPAAPAPVPAAVQIPRPSDAEVDVVRKSLADFLRSMDKRTRDIVEKYPGVLEVRTPPPNSAIVPNLAPMFRTKYEQNLDVAKKGDIELLLVGDSITDFWRNTEGNYAGAAVLQQYFGQWKIANFGIAGDTTQGVLYRLQNGEGQGFSPRAIMMMIGTNNTGRNSAPEIAEGIGAVVLELRKDFPAAKILLLGVFPRGMASDPVRGTISEINQIVSRLDDGRNVFYLDIGKAFLEPDGSISTSVMSDRLHPTPEGYRRWAEAVKEPLTKLMQPN